jgi:hypothetical protein
LDEVFLQPAPPGLNLFQGPYSWQIVLKKNRVYRFRVAGFSGRGAVHPGSWKEITVWSVEPPGQVLDFRAVPEDLTVKLTFKQPPNGFKVEVEKAVGDGGFAPLSLDQMPHLDLNVAYEHDYRYRARLVGLLDSVSTPGAFGSEILVKIRDLVPPRPIAYLDAALSTSGIRLTWESRADESDFGGYRLYRRIGDGVMQPLGGELKENFYFDPNPPADEDIRYQVTVLDNSPAKNEASPSVEATVYVAREEQAVERPETVDPGF